MSRRKSGRRSLRTLLGFFAFICFLDWIPQEHTFVCAKKTATRSSLVASTQLGGGGSSTSDVATFEEYSGNSQVDTENATLLSPIRRLQKDLTRIYDRTLPPVKELNKSIKIMIDMTYRQVLDLDEKNQILKSLIWYRQYWDDENLKWNPDDYGGITETTIPSSVVWRPDIAVYEEVAARDFNPRLPFVKVQSSGEILLAEPTILETSCSVDTAFFPFDSQLCAMTFVSWTQPLTHIDLRAKRTPEMLEEDIALFIDSGEWVLTDFSVRKQITRYDILATDNETKVQSTEHNDIFSGIGARATRVDPTLAIEPWDIDGNASHLMYSELRYSLVIRRNSSLYMQSMLFPSILLTSVALLGFYLPPDSGERVGLQITILLTFMVFLLTVGEMFPASTGPYIGMYFVLSMAQLGVNILMTIIVLHLHFKPCVRDPATWKTLHEGGQKEPESMIPIKLRRVLQFCNRYVKVADPGVAWMLPITKSPLPDLKSVPVCKLQIEKPEDENRINSSRSDCNAADQNGVKSSDEALRMVDEVPSYETVTPTKTEKRRFSKDIFKRTRSPSKSPAQSSPAGRGDDLQKMINEFRLDVKDIVKDGVQKRLHEKDTEEEMEESMEKEQEEWKSVARAVDKLFFRLYMLLMFISYAALGGVALRAHFKISAELENN